MSVLPHEVYKCLVCGIVVEVLDDGAGEPVCCGRPMTLQRPQTDADGRDEHVPMLDPVDGGTRVRVGWRTHPSQATHFIQWVELLTGDRVCRRTFAPGQVPDAVLPLSGKGLAVRAFCSVHGLWQT